MSESGQFISEIYIWYIKHFYDFSINNLRSIILINFDSFLQKMKGVDILNNGTTKHIVKLTLHTLVSLINVLAHISVHGIKQDFLGITYKNTSRLINFFEKFPKKNKRTICMLIRDTRVCNMHTLETRSSYFLHRLIE